MICTLASRMMVLSRRWDRNIRDGYQIPNSINQIPNKIQNPIFNDEILDKFQVTSPKRQTNPKSQIRILFDEYSSQLELYRIPHTKLRSIIRPNSIKLILIASIEPHIPLNSKQQIPKRHIRKRTIGAKTFAQSFFHAQI